MNFISTWTDFQKLRWNVNKNKLPIKKVWLDDGYLYLQVESNEYKIHGHWDEEKKSDIIEWLVSSNDEAFSLLKEKRFIFGKDSIERIVSLEVSDSTIELFTENERGTVESRLVPNRYWVLSSKKLDNTWQALKGSLHYKYIKYWDNKDDYKEDRRKLYKFDTFSIWDDKEAAMVLNGYTYFKGMKVKDVSVLSFDIEASGLKHDKNSFVFCISNTFRRNGHTTKRLFSIDEYSSQAEMFDDWCSFVREINPAVIIAHNGFGYDLPYLNFCAEKEGAALNLGRDGSAIRFDEKTSKFRKDGSQDYEYNRCYIHGREIVDTMFLAYHYDFARKYDNYGLKNIIRQEGLEKKDRQHYDASQIAKNWSNPAEREKIKKYVIDDSDDALALYDLMINSFFYFNQSIPKTFQTMNYSATGSQLNAFLIRSYLQDGHSIPKASAPKKFVGAISIGNPGVYTNCWKQDIQSLYPSIILQYEVYDRFKDPSQNFLKMVKYFTKERLHNKAMAKKTGDRYYTDLEQSQKIGINSSYGLLGSVGLCFNSPANAAMVTEKGREILKKAILWATGKEFVEPVPEQEEVQNEDT